LGAFCRYGTSIEPRLSELVIITAGAYWKAGFEWRVHAPIAGISEDIIAAVSGAALMMLAGTGARLTDPQFAIPLTVEPTILSATPLVHCFCTIFERTDQHRLARSRQITRINHNDTFITIKNAICRNREKLGHVTPTQERHGLADLSKTSAPGIGPKISLIFLASQSCGMTVAHANFFLTSASIAASNNQILNCGKMRREGCCIEQYQRHPLRGRG
jgi:hypothetical protein